MQSRHLRKGWDGDLPLHLNEWFEAEKCVLNEGGLKMLPDALGRRDTLGPCATNPQPEHRAPRKRCNGPTMIYPKTVEAKDSNVKMVPQVEAWRKEEKPTGCRKFPPRVAEVRPTGGLKIIRDEKTGERFAEKRSQVMSFSDLTGTKRTFRGKPGFKDPSRQDPDAFPGLKGRRSDFDASGNMVDFSLKCNGGIFGQKRLPDVTVYKGGGEHGGCAQSEAGPLRNRTNTVIGGSGGNGGGEPPGGGAPTLGPGAPSHGAKGKVHKIGIDSFFCTR